MESVLKAQVGALLVVRSPAVRAASIAYSVPPP